MASVWGDSWGNSFGDSWGTRSTVVTELRVSWLQFDTQATPCDVKVSWVQFDTHAVPCDTKVSWVQFNTRAKPEESSAKSGYNRLFYYQLQEAYLEELAAKDKKTEAKVVEVKKAKRKEVEKLANPQVNTRPSVPRRTEPKIPLVPLRTAKTSAPVLTYELPRIWQITQELRVIRARWGIMQVASHQLDAVNDEDDIELLLLVA